MTDQPNRTEMVIVAGTVNGRPAEVRMQRHEAEKQRLEILRTANPGPRETPPAISPPTKRRRTAKDKAREPEGDK